MQWILFLSIILILATLGMSSLLKKPSPYDGPGGENRGKSQWPDMLGKRKEVVEAAIKAERPDLTVHTVPENAMVTMDYKPSRLRLFVDKNGIVVQPPAVG